MGESYLSSVSYTHLDVYKRQLYEFARFQIVSAKTGKVFGNDRRHSSGFHFLQHRLQPLAPVSYTHLMKQKEQLAAQEQKLEELTLKIEDVETCLLYTSPTFSCHPMHRPNTQTARPYGTP